MGQEQSNSDRNAVSVDAAGSPGPELYKFLGEILSRPTWEPGGSSSAKNEGVTLGQVDVPTDELFKVLSNRRRRYVLSYLTQHATEVDLGTLATQIAAWENDKDVSQVNGMERKRVYTSLQQVHLPKMDDSGVVKFDKRSGTITQRASVTDYEFGGEVDNNRRWYRYYAILSAGNASFVGLTIVNIWPSATVSDFGLVVMILVSFALLATVHMAATRHSETITQFV